MPTPAAMLSATALDLNTVEIDFDVAMDPTTLTGGIGTWRFITTDGLAVDALGAVMSVGDTRATVTVHTELTAGAQYTVLSLTGKSFDGGALSPAVENFTPSVALAPANEGLQRSILDAWAVAIGREMQRLNGVPITLLLQPLTIDSTFAIVESTEGFPDEGAFWAGGRRFTYTSKSSGAFLGLGIDDLMLRPVPQRAEVVLDVTSA